jgi:hypothetical protein
MERVVLSLLQGGAFPQPCAHPRTSQGPSSMSIYKSIQPQELCNIPERDTYNAYPYEGLTPMMVDVAVALSWHDCIRLDIVRSDDQILLLTVEEASMLVDTLNKAIGAIKNGL